MLMSWCVSAAVASLPASERRAHHDGAGVGGMADAGASFGGAAGGSGGGVWSCQHCTFHNAPHQSACEICGLPRL